MTRGMFFRVLAAVGLGQGVGWPDAKPRPMWPTAQRVIRTQVDPTPQCNKNEEHCPLGHCQKPRILEVKSADITERVAEAMECLKKSTHRFDLDCGYITSPWETNEQHVCSACGIVYIPLREKP
jgi:hypothetical protein